ncbi:HEAT repeat domain-containing protein [Chamaesiphon sp. VAR_48_metabat_403]|uniref:HEAT repeat domain-containing protein n=1 Tax=Chamaesiphon sp. VAR_48_metabat_403 TaxID=2964700 RepID=UPI0037C0B201
MQSITEQIDRDTFDADDVTTLKQMVECLGDARGLVRLRFAQTLGDIGGTATPLLVDALLHHPNPVVRRAAGKTLALIIDPTTVPSLLHALLNDEDTVVRGSAVGALAKMGEASVPALLGILADPLRSESTKGHAAWALGFIGADAAPFLEDAIKSDSIDVRCATVGAIAHLVQEKGDARAAQLLLATLKDRDPNVRSEAASAIGKMAYLPALPDLITALSDTDGEVRRTAAVSLGKLGDRSAIPHLQSVLNDELEPVRVLAKLAISKIENHEEWE